MKQLLTFFLVFFVFSSISQPMSIEEWDELAAINKRLLPKYGYILKSEEEKKADEDFIKTVLKEDLTRKKGSDHLIKIGFNYLYKNDLKIAMSRFNQAYLIDSTNADIYWGYGAIYFTLQDFQRAKQQYDAGLAIDPQNTHLLTDLATYYLAQYYGLQPISEKDALENLNHAVEYLLKSYAIDPKDQNTCFKLSVCFLNKKDCKNAKKYYKECKELGGAPITEDYTNELKKVCKR